MSVVEYFSARTSSCGYCKAQDQNQSYGMWAHRLTVKDYQILIDLGWRRSGHYCYKSIMDQTCCPLYAIKCDALSFKLSKSQKKLIKRVNKYLIEGKEPAKHEVEPSEEFHAGSEMVDYTPEVKTINNSEIYMKQESNAATTSAEKQTFLVEKQENQESNKRTPKPGVGYDPSKPRCKKAKLIRLEKKQKINQPVKQEEKSLEDFLSLDKINNLELKLVRSNPPSQEFVDTFNESHALYQKYQCAVHKEPPHKMTKEQFNRFLVQSPLVFSKSSCEAFPGYGSFHQQYWLNGKLIAVAVLDILPKAVSSVYYFYDPDYSFLSLGTYSSLREIAMVRYINKSCPSINEYYLGLYVHSCPKMRYKAKLSSSYLLCPETYTWHSMESAKIKLDVNKYSKFSDEPVPEEPVDINNVTILHSNEIMTYGQYKSIFGSGNDEKIQEYAQLVGNYCATSLILAL